MYTTRINSHTSRNKEQLCTGLYLWLTRRVFFLQLKSPSTSAIAPQFSNCPPPWQHSKVSGQRKNYFLLTYFSWLASLVVFRDQRNNRFKPCLHLTSINEVTYRVACQVRMHIRNRNKKTKDGFPTSIERDTILPLRGKLFGL
jgi:hypothetical protein